MWFWYRCSEYSALTSYLEVEFFADETHGTEYEKIMGLRENDLEQSEIEEIIRNDVSGVRGLQCIEGNKYCVWKRSLIVDVVAVLEDGEKN